MGERTGSDRLCRRCFDAEPTQLREGGHQLQGDAHQGLRRTGCARIDVREVDGDVKEARLRDQLLEARPVDHVAPHGMLARRIPEGVRVRGAEREGFARTQAAPFAVDLEFDLTLEDLDLVIMHQANLRINEGVQKRLGLPDEKVFNNIQNYGNTTAGTIPIAYHEALEQGRAKPGDLVAFVGLGSGLNWGAVLYRC